MTEHTCTRHPAGSAICYREHACRCPDCRREGRRYTKQQESGLRARVPADIARLHIARLIRAGMSELAIARASSVAQSTINRIRTGVPATTWQHTARAILAVTPTGDLSGMVDATGTRRRLQALAAIGHSSRRISAATGIAETNVRRIRRGGQPSVAAKTAAIVRDYYDHVSARPAEQPDIRLINHARRHGWPAPMCWDDIDDPAATPSSAPAGRHGSTVEDIAWCIEAGETNPEAIAGRVGITTKSLREVLRRAGRGDLSARLTGPTTDGRAA